MRGMNRGRANLGDALEELLSLSCRIYQRQGTALIQKVTTPYKIIGTSSRGLLAVPDEKSTVDYIGSWRGRPIALEAKETSSPTSYRLDPWDREDHQRDFLTRWESDGGIAGYIIGFRKLGEVYYVPWCDYKHWRERSQDGGRKSIPIRWFREHAQRIQARAVPFDFLAAIEAAESNK